VDAWELAPVARIVTGPGMEAAMEPALREMGAAELLIKYRGH